MENLSLISIQQIKSKSSLKKFDCGIKELNLYLHGYAQKNDVLGLGKTFIALDEDNNILGYFTLSTAQINYEELPTGYKTNLPKYPIPSLRIARLAVQKDLQGNGIGKKLLTLAFLKIIQVSDITGLYLIIVDAKESSESFYKHYGFIKLNDKELTYFLPVETVRKAISDNS